MSKLLITLIILAVNIFTLSIGACTTDDIVAEKIPKRLAPHVTRFLHYAPTLCNKLLNRESYQTHENFQTLLSETGRFLGDARADNFDFDRAYYSESIVDFDNPHNYYFINIYLQSHVRSLAQPLILSGPCAKSEYNSNKSLRGLDVNDLKHKEIFKCFKFNILYTFMDRMYRMIKHKFIINIIDDKWINPIFDAMPDIYPHKIGRFVFMPKGDEAIYTNVLNLPSDDNFLYIVAFAKIILNNFTSHKNTLQEINALKKNADDYLSVDFSPLKISKSQRFAVLF